MADLLSILQRKLDISPESASARLKAYVEFIRAKADDEGGLEVQDLGRFFVRGDEIRFEPENALITAVNFRYQSLPVVTATGDILVIEADEKVEADAGPTTSVDESAEVASSTTQTPEAGPDEGISEQEREAPPVGQSDGDSPVDAEESKPEPVTDPDPEIRAEPPDEPDSAEPVGALPDVPDRPKVVAAPPKPRSPALVYGLPAAVAGVALLIWFLLFGESPVSDMNQGETQISTTVEQPVDSGAGIDPTNDGSLAEEQRADSESASADPALALLNDSETESAEAPAPAATPTQIPVTRPATSNTSQSGESESVSSVVIAAPTKTDDRSMADFPPSGRVYAVIVGSTITRPQAEVHVKNLPSLNYPVSIIAYNTDSTTGFRVGVGLFRTIAEADAVRKELVDVLPDGSWVFRAQ